MIYFLLLFFLSGCVAVEIVPVNDEQEDTAPYHACFPVRGEDQEPELRVKGQAYNTMSHGCV